MRAHNRLLITVLAGGTVALMASPAPASAQAIPRTTSGEATSSAPPPQSQPVRSAPPTGSSGSSSSGSSSGSTSGGAVSSRPSGSSGSGNVGGTSAIRRGGGSSGTATSRPSGGGSDTPIYVGAGSRDRNGRPITNTAIHRASPIGGSMFNERWLGSAGYPFSPWGRWYPWYSGGWGYGWVSYDPWRFGSTRWVWGRYGTWWYNPTPWYDPWYDPYYGWYGMTYWSGGGGGYSTSRGDSPSTGAVRVKVNPSQAQVYVDGVLQGIVDDFNGLSSHLEMSAGAHQIEIRLDGYRTLKDTINVEGGKTLTFRGSLKK